MWFPEIPYQGFFLVSPRWGLLCLFGCQELHIFPLGIYYTSPFLGNYIHRRYVGRPLPPSIHNLLLNQDLERAMIARRAYKPDPGPTIVGRLAPGVGLGGGSGAGESPPGNIWGGTNREPCPNPCPIPCLHLLLMENRIRVYQNVKLPILGGAAFWKRWHLGFSCFKKCPCKGSHIHPLAAVVDKVAGVMMTDWDPVVGELGSTWWGGVVTPAPPSLLSTTLNRKFGVLGKCKYFVSSGAKPKEVGVELCSSTIK